MGKWDNMITTSLLTWHSIEGSRFSLTSAYARLRTRIFCHLGNGGLDNYKLHNQMHFNGILNRQWDLHFKDSSNPSWHIMINLSSTYIHQTILQITQCSSSSLVPAACMVVHDFLFAFTRQYHCWLPLPPLAAALLRRPLKNSFQPDRSPAAMDRISRDARGNIHCEAQARVRQGSARDGKGWPLRRKALKLKTLA